MTYMHAIIKSLGMRYAECNISVIALHYPFSKVKYSFYHAHVFPMNGRNSKRMKLLTFYRSWKKLKAIHKECPINGILCLWLNEASFLGKLFGEKFGIPYLYWAFGQDVKPSNRYLKLIRPQKEHLAVMSTWQIEILSQSKIYAERVIENGILPEDFVWEAEDGNSDEIDILGVGSLSLLKNYKEFVEIVALVAKQFPEIKCSLVGEGPCEAELREQIKIRKLEERVQLKNFAPHHQILGQMKKSLIFLHPSHFEGNSTVMLEAAMAGNYIICREGISRYSHSLIHSYGNAENAAKIICAILRKGKNKPEGVMLSNIHDRMGEVMDYFNKE